jgi:hypothetical protein
MSNTLEQLITLGEQLTKEHKDLMDLEARIEQTKADIGMLEKRLIPDIMNMVGLTELKLKDGSKITLKPDVGGSVPKDRMEAVSDWLEANNSAAIMKRSLVVDFDKKEQLIAANTPFSINTSIHHSTLQAFIREQVETNPEFPRELFGVYEAQKAVVKTAR